MSLMTFASKPLESARVAHAFFSRDGGVSEGIYEGLNCGQGSRDDPEHIAENRKRVAGHFSTTPGQLCTLYQIHSADVVTVSEPTQGSIKADAMVTTHPNLVLGILTADCAPVLFSDPQAGVIGAAHAGWKGALAGVLDNTVQAMMKMGARRDRITACIGPAIGQESYEVGPDLIEAVTRKDATAKRFFQPNTKRNHGQFDLQGFVRHQLERAGLQHVSVVAMDTYVNEPQVYSYRRTTHRAEPDYGRHISCIMLRERRVGGQNFTGTERRAR